VVAVGLTITPASADVLRKTKKGMVKARAPRASLARRQLDMAALGLQVAVFFSTDRPTPRPTPVPYATLFEESTTASMEGAIG